jgi:hypothetical protein
MISARHSHLQEGAPAESDPQTVGTRGKQQLVQLVATVSAPVSR